MTNRSKLILLAIVLVGMFLRVRLSMDRCLHKWDERFHALVAKNLLKHPLKPTLYEDPALPFDYKLWYANHIWLHKPPLPLWLMGASYSIFGTSGFVTRIPSLLISLVVILLTFWLGKKLFSEKVGLLAASFCSINGLLVEISSGAITTDHYDTLYMGFILIAIAFAYLAATRNSLMYNTLTGVFLGCAILTKWLPALIVLPIQVCFLLQNQRSIRQILLAVSISACTAVLLVLPWHWFTSTAYPLEYAWEQHFNWLHFTNELEGHDDSEGFLFYFNRLRINYSEIVYLPLIYFIFKMRKIPQVYNSIGLIIWIFVPVLFFSFSSTKLQGYILFISPALFIVTAFFFFEVKDKIGTIGNRWSKGIFVLLLVSMLVIPIRYCFERTAFGFGPERCTTGTIDYDRFEKELQPKSIVMNVEDPISFMFFTSHTAYAMPYFENDVILDLKKRGYSIYKYESNTNSVTKY